MTGEPAPRVTRRWELDTEAFQALLRALDPEPQRSAREYERLRSRLVRYFRLHGVAHPLEASDEAFNRLAKRLSEGEPVVNIEAYLAGIARLVMLEERQKTQREQQMLMRLVPSDAPAEDEPMLQALEAALAELPEATRELMARYYLGRGRARMRAREALAHELGLSANTLRNRVLRLRRRLEQAVRARLGEDERDVCGVPPTVDEEVP
jgi:DNA-directed RNA polymerase specialized sigma24 family protein